MVEQHTLHLINNTYIIQTWLLQAVKSYHTCRSALHKSLYKALFSYAYLCFDIKKLLQFVICALIGDQKGMRATVKSYRQSDL